MELQQQEVLMLPWWSFSNFWLHFYNSSFFYGALYNISTRTVPLFHVQSQHRDSMECSSQCTASTAIVTCKTKPMSLDRIEKPLWAILRANAICPIERNLILILFHIMLYSAVFHTTLLIISFDTGSLASWIIIENNNKTWQTLCQQFCVTMSSHWTSHSQAFAF